MNEALNPHIPEKFLKPYNPQDTEDRIYSLWEKSGYFNPDKLPERHKEPYTIVLPPPNVTGTLHMGHASMLAIEDIIIRYKRMQGFKTLWLPGTDHAAIATQSKVEKELEKKEGKRKTDLGREEFLKRVNAFAQESHDTIVGQVKKMGASIDWSREAFTLDDKRSYAVRTAFKTMYDLGLIYRGNRIINWDPKGQTTISDDEIVHEERKTTMYTFKYSADFPIPIATVRPETKVGDVAVAVHPEDMRYKEYIGKTYKVNFAGVDLSIVIVGDTAVDPQYGTGAVGVTPAHSAIDAEIAQRHSLPSIQVIDEYAKMMPHTGNIAGLKVIPAREKIAAWLKENNLLIKEEEVVQNLTTAERTGGIIEPLPKIQWFIAVNRPFVKNGKETTLKEIMLSAVNDKKIEIVPERFEKVYVHWINNLRDWCISRQIWYGHRIPVWYKDKEMYVGIEAPQGEGWEQDPDTLDTWFSSGLWTFSTLGWPEKTDDLFRYHPTDLLETGYDILFFWVARMILMTGCLLDTIPFKKVYLHGLVRDGQGRKMSKSLGNIIDPLDMISKYSADATRLSLIIGNGPGNDSKLSEDKVKGYKNFGNKLWNITRFVLGVAPMESRIQGFDAYTAEDMELRKVFQALVTDITHDIESFRLYLAAEKLYHYTWHEFADKILEESKKIMKEGSEEEKKSREQFLLATLRDILIISHPFMPYITEEIWGTFPDSKNLLIVEPWVKVG